MAELLQHDRQLLALMRRTTDSQPSGLLARLRLRTEMKLSAAEMDGLVALIHRKTAEMIAAAHEAGWQGIPSATIHDQVEGLDGRAPTNRKPSR